MALEVVTAAQGAVLVSEALQNQNDIATRLYNWQQDNDVLSAGFGEYGVPKEEVQDVPISAIWCDEDVFCLGEADIELRDNSDELNAAKEAYHMHAFRDDNGVIRSSLWRPLIVIERQNPNDKSNRQKLMLTDGYRPWRCARELIEKGWTVLPALIRPDFGNYRIEYASLFVKCQDSAPPMFEIAKHVARLNWYFDQGLIPPGSPQPPKLVQAAKALGKSPAYFYKMGRLWQLQEADDAFAAGVPLRVIIKAAETYGVESPRLGPALQYITSEGMNTPQAEKFIKEDNASLRLTDAYEQRVRNTPSAPAAATVDSHPANQSTFNAANNAAPTPPAPKIGKSPQQVVKAVLNHLEDIVMLLDGESKPEAQAGFGDNYATFLQAMKRQRDIADEMYLASIAQGQ